MLVFTINRKYLVVLLLTCSANRNEGRQRRLSFMRKKGEKQAERRLLTLRLFLTRSEQPAELSLLYPALRIVFSWRLLRWFLSLNGFLLPHRFCSSSRVRGLLEFTHLGVNLQLSDAHGRINQWKLFKFALKFHGEISRVRLLDLYTFYLFIYFLITAWFSLPYFFQQGRARMLMEAYLVQTITTPSLSCQLSDAQRFAALNFMTITVIILSPLPHTHIPVANRSKMRMATANIEVTQWFLMDLPERRSALFPFGSPFSSSLMLQKLNQAFTILVNRSWTSMSKNGELHRDFQRTRCVHDKQQWQNWRANHQCAGLPGSGQN